MTIRNPIFQSIGQWFERTFADPEVISLFKDNPKKYSLSIHGCDHTGAEFGSHDRDALRSKARQATDRMSGHELKTGLRHERIMVFPQGVFSEAAIGALGTDRSWSEENPKAAIFSASRASAPASRPGNC